MNKERVISSFGTAILIVAIWTFIILFCGPAMAQHSHSNDSFERFERLRIYPPAEIKYFDGKRIEYLITTGKEIKAGHFIVEEDTEIPKDLIKTHKGKYWLLYCIDDQHLYGVVKKQ